MMLKSSMLATMPRKFPSTWLYNIFLNVSYCEGKYDWIKNKINI